ncbi:MAG: hypothetical protein J5605_03750 [Bacteroidales bacterium]|nr:hypothetical protein [Bacteroidales bacterium]
MNNTFDFNRFKKVVARDFYATYSRFGLGILILSLLVVAVWIMSLVSGIPNYYLDPDINIDTDLFYNNILGKRVAIIVFGVFLSVTIAPAIIYKSCNLKGRGNYYALLPASNLEKYLSMFLHCCIVAPLAVILGSLLVDTLLTLLPVGYFRDFIWNYDSWLFESEGCLLVIANFLLNASIYMFTNTIFKKSKFIKTVLWLMLIGFVLLLTLPSSLRLINSYWTIFIVILVLSLVLQYFTYRRLKNMQY